MTIKVQDSVKYWEKEWKNRITEDGVSHNHKKAEFLIAELWSRPHYFKLKKLEIGCGTAFQVIEMAKYCDLWRETWTGIDVSKTAIDYARKHGFNAHKANIFTWRTKEKFDLFMMLDVMEHLPDHDKLARRIKALASEKFYIFLNVPLYMSAHERAIERPVGSFNVMKLFKNCGITYHQTAIYGIGNLPYMMAEGKNF